MIDPKLEAFLTDLIRRAHKTVLPEALEKQMVWDLAIELENRLTAATEEKLSEIDRVEYQALVGRNASQQEVQEFLHQHIPDLDQLMQVTVKQFESDYLEFTQPA